MGDGAMGASLRAGGGACCSAGAGRCLLARLPCRAQTCVTSPLADLDPPCPPPPPAPRPRPSTDRIMLESFISTQKLSVQKALRRKFRRFVVTKADFDQLVLFKLQECARDARRVEQITGVEEDPSAYVVQVRQLEERCRDMDITDLAPFFGSRAFADAGFALSADGNSLRLARA